MAKRHWLMKSEPSVFSIDDLAKVGTTSWDGVRNYQARNLLRDDVKAGDEVLFYHSSAEPSGVAGIAKVARAAYPDPTQFDKKSEYHDPGSTRDDPRWLTVDVTFVRKLPRVVTLSELKANPALAEMVVTKKGSRLSVQPVTPQEFAAVVAMGTEKLRHGEMLGRSGGGSYDRPPSERHRPLNPVPGWRNWQTR